MGQCWFNDLEARIWYSSQILEGWITFPGILYTGSELCTVVETMFSYEVLFHIIGDPKFAERAEQLTYNALPATITSNMWAHQYLQQSNQMEAVVSPLHVWKSDGRNATL